MRSRVQANADLSRPGATIVSCETFFPKANDGSDADLITSLSILVSALQDILDEVESDYRNVPSYRGAVINMSLGWAAHPLADEEAVRRMISSVVNAGIPFVTAAGHSGSEAINLHPCGFVDVLCVGSVKQNYEMSEWSNWGIAVLMLAPGEEVVVIDPANNIDGTGYTTQTGTSYAAPLVAASLASIISWDELKLPEHKDLAVTRLLLNAQTNAIAPGTLKGTPNILLNTGVQHPDKWDFQPYRYAKGVEPPSEWVKSLDDADFDF